MCPPKTSQANTAMIINGNQNLSTPVLYHDSQTSMSIFKFNILGLLEQAPPRIDIQIRLRQDRLG